MSSRIGCVTIGQSPREDVVSDLRAGLGPGIEIIERGALDGCSPQDIDALRAGKNDFPLITRLRNGSSVVVGKRKITPLIQRQISSLERAGVRLTALLCTDEFPELRPRGILLMPSRILFAAATSILPRGRIGVLAPLEEQRERVEKKWLETGLDVFVEILDPYQEASAPARAAELMSVHRPDLIVLDCIGYSSSVRDALRLRAGKPVLWPRGLLAAWIVELI